MNKQQLASTIWESANKMRSKIEANEYKDYILGFMFYKFLSNKEINELITLGYEEEDLEENLKENNDTLKVNIQNRIGYFISYNNLFSTWVKRGNSVGIANVRDALNAFSRLIYKGNDGKVTTYTKVFDGIFTTLETGLSKLGDSESNQNNAVRDLITLINRIPMDNNQDYDVLGFVYEYLISNFAANAGKKAGEFYTPHEVSLLMSEIVAEHLKNRSEIEIYDPTSGSGSLLINIGKTTSKYIKKENKIKYYAQELKQNTYNLTRMNLVMRGIIPSNIFTRNGDTLEDDWPFFDENHEYSPLFVDAVVSNPPYSQTWDSTNKEFDPRYKEYGLAPKSKADYAFLLHDLYHLESDGIMTIVLPHGVLFRGGEEGEIRKNLIEKNNIDTIIGLPSNIFFGTGIPTIIMVLKKTRENNDILIVDASKGFAKEGKNNKLRACDIKKVVDTVVNRIEIEKYSKIVSKEEIRNNDYNLNIPRYVDSSEENENFDIYSLMNGEIPNYELDRFNAFFKVFPNLRENLFIKVNELYSELKSEDIYEKIKNHNDIEKYKSEYKKVFSDFDSFLKETLIDNINSIDTNNAESLITNNLFNRVDNVPLIDKYVSYQIFSDMWKEISGDLEIINSEGITACNKIDPVTESKKKGDKEIDIQIGVKGRIIPINIVISEMLSKENDEIREKENRLVGIETEISELFDDLSEDEKTEISNILTDDNDAFVAKEVAKRAKELLKTKIEDNSIECKIIKANDLFEEEKTLTKQIKTDKDKLETKAEKIIEKLNENEIYNLLHIKWIYPIVKGIDNQVENMINDFSKNLEILSKKYKTTLVHIDNEIKETEKELSKMIDELTGSEFDMKGLEDFKSLISGI